MAQEVKQEQHSQPICQQPKRWWLLKECEGTVLKYDDKKQIWVVFPHFGASIGMWTTLMIGEMHENITTYNGNLHNQCLVFSIKIKGHHFSCISSFRQC